MDSDDALNAIEEEYQKLPKPSAGRDFTEDEYRWGRHLVRFSYYLSSRKEQLSEQKWQFIADCSETLNFYLSIGYEHAAEAVFIIAYRFDKHHKEIFEQMKKDKWK